MYKIVLLKAFFLLFLNILLSNINCINLEIFNYIYCETPQWSMGSSRCLLNCRLNPTSIHQCNFCLLTYPYFTEWVTVRRKLWSFWSFYRSYLRWMSTFCNVTHRYIKAKEIEQIFCFIYFNYYIKNICAVWKKFFDWRFHQKKKNSSKKLWNRIT